MDTHYSIGSGHVHPEVKQRPVFRIWIHVDASKGSPGSGSILGIQIRIQDSQNGVQKRKKIGDFKLKRALTI